MRKPQKQSAGVCPSCNSWYIRPHYKVWCCKTCAEIFDSPVVYVEKQKACGSGQIAPRTYRMQLALEQLAQSGKRIKTEGSYYGKKP